MAGIDGAEKYAERLDGLPSCDVCGSVFPLKRGSRVGLGAVAVRGIGVVEYCSKDCLEKLQRSLV